jgi:hypothetical protein
VGYIPNRLAASITSRILPAGKFYNALRASKDQFHLASNNSENTISYNNCSPYHRARLGAPPVAAQQASALACHAAIPSPLDATRRSPTARVWITLNISSRRRSRRTLHGRRAKNIVKNRP